MNQTNSFEMKEVQSGLLKTYMELKGSPSLREISEDTGIQITRVFRIFNGSEMKLKEYLIFKRKVDELSGVSLEVWDLIKELQGSLSPQRLKTVVKRMKRDLAYGQLADKAWA